MSFFSVTLKDLHRDPGLDPDKCLEAVESSFRDVVRTEPGDHYALSLERASAFFGNPPANHPVIRAIERDMRTQGPSRHFFMNLGGKDIRGAAKRSSFTLIWKGRVEKATLEKIADLVLSVSPPRDELVVEIEQHD